MGFFIPTTVVQPVCAGPGNCGQHAASVAQESPAGGAGVALEAAVAVGAAGVAAGHCAAQLDCLHVPTACPACAQPGAIRAPMHCIMLPPPQTHRVKSGQVVPTVWSGPAQLVDMQLLQASVALGSMLPRHAMMSAFAGEADATGGLGVLSAAAVGGALAGVEDGVAGGGSDAHAIPQPAKRTTKIDSR